MQMSRIVWINYNEQEIDTIVCIDRYLALQLRHSGPNLGDFVKKIIMTIKMQQILRLQQALLCALIRLGTQVTTLNLFFYRSSLVYLRLVQMMWAYVDTGPW